MPRPRRDVVVILWRDIPAQVNGQAGRDRHQLLLSEKFQRAIDRAKRKAKINTAQEDVAQWRRVSHPVDGDLQAAAEAEVDRLEADYTDERLGAAGLRRRLGTTRTTKGTMTQTVLSSASREVVIGFDRPFVMIGERINPTGRKLLAEEMKRGDFSRVEADAVAQVGAGAHMLDVNAGIPLADEPALLARAVQLVQSVTDVPLSIDSSIVEALEAGLAVYQGKPLVNSVTGEDEVMERVLPLVARSRGRRRRHLQRRDGHQRGPRRALLDRQAHRRAGRRPRHPGRRRRRRPARDADRRDGHGRAAGLHLDPPPARGAQGQHDVRRLEHQLRAAQPSGRDGHVPGHGHRLRDDVGDHEPAAPRGPQRPCWPPTS